LQGRTLVELEPRLEADIGETLVGRGEPCANGLLSRLRANLGLTLPAPGAVAVVVSAPEVRPGVQALMEMLMPSAAVIVAGEITAAVDVHAGDHALSRLETVS
jgi:hypothetical protein